MKFCGDCISVTNCTLRTGFSGMNLNNRKLCKLVGEVPLRFCLQILILQHWKIFKYADRTMNCLSIFPMIKLRRHFSCVHCLEIDTLAVLVYLWAVSAAGVYIACCKNDHWILYCVMSDPYWVPWEYFWSR